MTFRIRHVINNLSEGRRDSLKDLDLPVDIESTVLFASEHLNMSLNELIAIPEQDSWHYKTGDGMPIFTQASFIASALNQLGVFHGEEINAAEFTVTDIYQLDIYDKESDKPDICMEADYALDYCQLFGTYRLHLPGFSTIQPYANMNESCPNAFENKYRPAQC